MKKLICLLLSCVFVFGVCGAFAKHTDAAENQVGIDEFAEKVSEMIGKYGTSSQVELFAENDSLSDYETCRLIVKSAKKIDTLNAVSVISGYRNLWILQFKTPCDAEKADKYYSSLKCVEYSQPDRPVTMQSTDDYTEEQKTWGSEMTRTTEVRDYLENTALEEVTVAVIDSGIDYNNDIFDGRLIDNGVNFSDSGDKTGMSDDSKSHGTSVAGIITLNTPETTKLRSYKIFDSKGNSTDLILITAIDQAVSDGMDILNLSLGTLQSDAMLETLENAYESGAVIVTATGNSNTNCDKILPAAFEGSITVGAVDKDGKPADFSNYGKCLDIVAPGVDIYSCINGNKYDLGSGTSLAAPFATAAAALLLGYNSSLTPLQIETALKENAMPVTGSYSQEKAGNGILNIAQAIDIPRAEASDITTSSHDENTKVTVTFSQVENTDTYYTLDGSYPSKENGILYEEPFTILRSCRITWRNFSDNTSLFASKAKYEEITASAYIPPADYSAYNAAKAQVPSDLSIYVYETVDVLMDAVYLDVSGKLLTEQDIVDAQTKAILDAIAALKLKPADYVLVQAAIGNIPKDLSPYTPESVEALQTAVDSVDYNLDITKQSEVDAYADNINKAIENLEKEGFFTRLFRLIKEFFENIFSF